MLKKLPRVRDVMVVDEPTLPPEMPITDAIDFLLGGRIMGAPVVDKAGKLVGFFTDRDALNVLTRDVLENPENATVGAFMSREVVSMSPRMDVYYAAGLFLRYPFHKYPVLEDGKLVGQVSRRDVLRAVQANLLAD